MQPTGRDQFLKLLHAALSERTLSRLTLGKYRGDDATLQKLTVRPVDLKSGPHFSFVWRHATRDITKNLSPAAAETEITQSIGLDQFRDAHLFTALQSVQLETRDDGRSRVRIKMANHAPPTADATHNRTKDHLIDGKAGWLRDLGITNDRGLPRTGQSAKLRQIQKFVETFTHLQKSSGLGGEAVLRIADMGSGKGYLTLALADLLGSKAEITGIERRADLVETCNRVAQTHDLPNVRFRSGRIDDEASGLGRLDVLIALHACDTATDDAIAAGVDAGARLIVVAPCCQHELRPQLSAPAVLAPALRHGIFQERQAEFVTDALRALLLEAAGFETRVFQFVSTEHTAKNLMLAAWRTERATSAMRPAGLKAARDMAAFYGITRHALARRLGVDLESS